MNREEASGEQTRTDWYSMRGELMRLKVNKARCLSTMCATDVVQMVLTNEILKC